MNLSEQLKRPFPVKQIKWRVGATNRDKTKGIALAYVDSRMVMQRLDEVCGIGGWQCRYPFPGCCEIGIRIDDEWIWKANGAGETNIDGEKGQYSDAFKRAAVNFGISRYLYSLPNVWVELDQYKRIVKPPELPDWAIPENYDKIMKERKDA